MHQRKMSCELKKHTSESSSLEDSLGWQSLPTKQSKTKSYGLSHSLWYYVMVYLTNDPEIISHF